MREGGKGGSAASSFVVGQQVLLGNRSLYRGENEGVGEGALEIQKRRVTH